MNIFLFLFFLFLEKGTFSFYELELKCNLSNILLLIREKMVKNFCGGHCGCFYRFSCCLFTADWQWLFRKIPLFLNLWNDWVFFIVPEAQEDAAKRKHVSKQNFFDQLICVLFCLTSCDKDLKLFSLELRSCFFLHFSQNHLPIPLPMRICF